MPKALSKRIYNSKSAESLDDFKDEVLSVMQINNRVLDLEHFVPEWIQSIRSFRNRRRLRIRSQLRNRPSKKNDRYLNTVLWFVVVPESLNPDPDSSFQVNPDLDPGF
jgi:hypothetical protein